METLGKSFSILLVLIIVVSSLIIVESLPIGLAQSGTNENGIMSSDTTWTQAKSPYSLTGPVGVANGVTLTINPGVTVNLGLFYIEVNGTLNAQGTPTDKIIFNSEYQNIWPPRNVDLPCDNPTCKIENAILNQTSILGQSYYSNASVTINSCSFLGNSAINIWGTTTLSNSYITGAVSIRGSSTVTRNTLLNGIEIGGSFTLSNNDITNQQGIWVIDAGGSNTQTAKILDNVIYGGSTAGINLASPATIERNLIIDNNYGISVRTKNDNSIIIYNTIANNQFGIINPTSKQTISYNNIENNTDHNLSAGYDSVTATNNWWGTTDQSAINNSIDDNKDDFNLGTVNFVPFLTAPNSQAPSIKTQIPTPTATPTATANPTSTPTVPEFPTWIILTLLVTVTLPTLLIYFKKNKARLPIPTG